MSNHLTPNGGRSLRRAGLTLALAVGAVSAVQAQTEPPSGACVAPVQWTTTNYGVGTCAACHGGTGNPPAIAASTGAGSTTLGLFESWLGTSPPDNDATRLSRLRTRITGVNASMTGLAGAADADAQAVVNYLTCVRDLRVDTGSLTLTPAAAINQARTATFVIENPRSESVAFTTTVAANTQDFPQSGLSSTCGGTVPAGTPGTPGSCTVTVTFKPQPGTPTTRTGTLAVAFLTPVSAVLPHSRSITLTGTVLPPVYQFTAAAGPFSARLNRSADLLVGTLKNTGNASLAVSSITRASGSTAFTQSPADTARPLACSSTPLLDGNASCEVWLRFTPTAANLTTAPDTYAATFTVAHNAAGSPGSVSVTATGPQPLISPTTLSLLFGDVQSGVATPKTAQFSGVGTMPLTFTADPKLPGALSGTNPADFSVGTSCNSGVNATLASGSPCTVTVTFTPPLNAPVNVERSATLTINTDADNNAGALAITLRGTPVALPSPTVTFPTSAFASTAIGFATTTTATVTLNNPRTRAVNYAVTSTRAADFAVVGGTCPGTAGQVAGGGGSCTLLYRFQPAAPSPGDTDDRSTTLTVSFTGTGGDANPAAQSGTLSGRAVLPLTLSTAVLSPSSIVNTATTATLLLTNNTPSPLTPTGLPVTGAALADYSVDAASACRAGLAINASQSCALTLRFLPTLEGLRAASLGIEHAAYGSPQAVALQGTGQPVPQGEAAFSAQALNFGDQQRGSTSSALTVSLTNTGTAPLTVSALTLGGAHFADFSRSGSCVIGSPLAIGARCEMLLQFTPAQLGARNATLRVQSNARVNADVTIALSGNGIPVPVPVVGLSPLPLNFGDQAVGGLYPTRNLQLKNTGTADLLLASVTVQGAGFSLVPGSSCGTTLAAGATCDIPVAFGASSAGADYSGTVTLASNAADSPHSAQLVGKGALAAAPVLAWEPASATLNFGEVAVGTASAPQPLTLANRGPGGVKLTLLNAVGLDRANFGHVDGADACQIGVVLFEGTTCRVYVVFAPVQSGVKQVALQLAAGNSLPPALTLQGTGIGGPTAAMSTSVDALSFGTLAAGSRSAPQSITITSSGAALRMTALRVTGPFALSGGSCPALPFDLPADSACSVDITYQPQAEGASTGLLLIGEDSDPAQRKLQLSGTARKVDALSGGGCTIVNRPTLTDPTLWLLALGAALALWRRESARRRR